MVDVGRGKEYISHMVTNASKEIFERIPLLLREAHGKGLTKDEAIEYVTRIIFAELMSNTDFEGIIRTREGRELLRDTIKVEVKNHIKERRKIWAGKRRDIIKSKRSAEWKGEELEKLRKMYFTKEDVEEVRKEELGERERRRDFAKELEKENELIEKWEKEDETWDMEVERMGIMGAERPWKKYPARFRRLPLNERERIREGWYKEQRKKYKEKYGFWSRVTPWSKKRYDIRKERAMLRGDRGIAYGDAKVKDADAYARKAREYHKMRKEGASRKELKEMRKELKDLKKEARGSKLKRFARGANRAASAPGKFAKSAKSLVMKGFVLACFVGIGAVATVAIGLPIWFFLGFLAWGLFYLLPDPNDIKIPDEVKNLSGDNPLRWYMINPFSKKGMFVRNKHTGWGMLRSVVKISVFACFIIGIYNSAVPLGNIALIILSFFGYYSLKITYDVEKPYELIESIIRFGGLGFYFIPWVIMYGIFDSMLLAFIAMAFFAIPPIPKERKNSELFMMYDFYDKIIFAIIMVGVLIGFLVGWEVSPTLTATFIYFWFVSGIAGFFSPAQARPAMGFLMLGAATIIYGIGPGTQDVMSGLFGPWWPTIQNTFSSVTEPIAEAFSGFSNTLRSGWLLLTDPVGYATQLMNGTHAENPLGPTGSYGVEITDVSISSILPEQPFVITAMIENKGAFSAEGVTMHLSTGYEAPRGRGPSPALGPLLMFVPKAYKRDVMKFGEMFGIEDDELVKCWEDENLGDGCQNELEKQNIWQLTFTSKDGVSCYVIKEYELREKYIPVKVAVTYNYSSDSEVDVEFMSKNEWQRLAESNQLSQELKFIQSRYSTAPVEFPIGTPGLKNPILVGQPFHLGMRIEPSSIKGSIDVLEKVVLEYPGDFVLKPEGCSPGGRPEPSGNENTRRIVWEDLSGGPRVFYCPFEGLEESKLSGPTKTYVVRARAEYTFTKWKEKDTRIEFGGKCCDKDDCLEGQVCSEGMCIPEGAATAGELCPGRCEEPGPEELDSAIDAATAKYNVSKTLVNLVIRKESDRQHCSGEDVKMSVVGALGIMQLMPGTASSMGVNPCDYEQNIEGGVHYLYNNMQEFKDYDDQVRFSLAAYNCGTACVNNRITDYGRTWEDVEPHLPEETRNYVASICGVYGECENG